MWQFNDPCSITKHRGTCVPLAKVSAVKDWLPGNHWASGIRGWMSVSRNRGKDWRCVEWRLPFLSETKRGNSHDFRGKETLFEGFTPLKLKTIKDYKHDPRFCRHACGIPFSSRTLAKKNTGPAKRPVAPPKKETHLPTNPSDSGSMNIINIGDISRGVVRNSPNS